MLAQDNMKMGIDAHITQSFCLGVVMVFFFFFSWLNHEAGKS